VKALTLLVGLVAVVCLSAADDGYPLAVSFDGITVTRGPSVLVPGVKSALAFRFSDGRIVVGQGAGTRWSADGGKTWVPGPPGPGEKVAIDLGHDEILSIDSKSQRRPDGRFTLKLRRSLDDWQSQQAEQAVLDLPEAGPTSLGGGDVVDGFLFHHGILQLPGGRLIATMYGNYRGDSILCDGYPPELGQRKYRTVVVFSDDRGRTWGHPVLVAYDRMLGRGIPEGHPLAGRSLPNEQTETLTAVPAVTQEGFREADLARAPNGDLLCVMRSGGRNGGAAVLFPTPLYCARSHDLGQTWTLPAQIADRGVCPALGVLGDGVIVCTYSRPGNWVIFSADNGLTWKGAMQFGSSGAYDYLAVLAPDTFIVFHEVPEGPGKSVYATFFQVKAAAAPKDADLGNARGRNAASGKAADPE